MNAAAAPEEAADETQAQVQDEFSTRPGRFDTAAPIYTTSGWPVVPIIPGQNGAKGTPPEGLTGWNGTDLDPEQVTQYRRSHGKANVAVRCPAEVIGLDVDAYDGKPGKAQLERWAQEWGPLPPT